MSKWLGYAVSDDPDACGGCWIYPLASDYSHRETVERNVVRCVAAALGADPDDLPTFKVRVWSSANVDCADVLERMGSDLMCEDVARAAGYGHDGHGAALYVSEVVYPGTIEVAPDGASTPRAIWRRAGLPDEWGEAAYSGYMNAYIDEYDGDADAATAGFAEWLSNLAA